MAATVAGLRPSRAGEFFTLNLPNPFSEARFLMCITPMRRPPIDRATRKYNLECARCTRTHALFFPTEGSHALRNKDDDYYKMLAIFDAGG